MNILSETTLAGPRKLRPLARILGAPLARMELMCDIGVIYRYMAPRSHDQCPCTCLPAWAGEVAPSPVSYGSTLVITLDYACLHVPLRTRIRQSPDFWR